jgi:tRNA-Thr(GGU) m(6)t(6)A37 methyltransferase TsaA
MTESAEFIVHPIGFVRSPLKNRKGAPRQGAEGAPDAWLEINTAFAEALLGVAVGDEIIVITWLHQSRRQTLQVHPRGDKSNPLIGVFATRSPDRPNPLGLHPVKVLEIEGGNLKVGPIEAIDGTPVVDIKPVLCKPADS